MQYQKHLEPRKKGNDGYDFKIFIIINAHKKHLWFSIHDLMGITIKPTNIFITGR
jgi:hypothetical protein